MTKKDIVNRIQEQVGLPASTVSDILDEMLEIIKDRLVAGEEVKIVRFGSFVAQTRAERKGRNPQTGEELVIPERKVLIFKPSKLLKKNL